MKIHIIPRKDIAMKRIISVCLACCSILGFSACAVDNQSPKTVDKNIESRITIPNGIYGLAYSVNDVGNADEEVIPGFKVKIKIINDTNEIPIDSITANEKGIFQKSLSRGMYKLCTDFGRCTTISIDSTLKRCDYESSVGPGWTCR